MRSRTRPGLDPAALREEMESYHLACIMCIISLSVGTGSRCVRSAFHVNHFTTVFKTGGSIYGRTDIQTELRFQSKVLKGFMRALWTSINYYRLYLFLGHTVIAILFM